MTILGVHEFLNCNGNVRSRHKNGRSPVAKVLFSINTPRTASFVPAVALTNTIFTDCGIRQAKF
ncbi:hypothetical protein IQ243_01690 [Nostocales cyanobacterium LEGE 11386]|nr:hypothetical protein [Nostocales cyanobacterium LEGE 11386]